MDACCPGCQPIIGDAVIHTITDATDPANPVITYGCSISCDATSNSNNNYFSTFAAVNTANNFNTANSLNPSIANILRLRAALGLGTNSLFDDAGLDDQKDNDDQQEDGVNNNNQTSWQ